MGLLSGFIVHQSIFCHSEWPYGGSLSGDSVRIKPGSIVPAWEKNTCFVQFWVTSWNKELKVARIYSPITAFRLEGSEKKKCLQKNLRTEITAKRQIDVKWFETIRVHICESTVEIPKLFVFSQFNQLYENLVVNNKYRVFLSRAYGLTVFLGYFF